MSTQPVIPVVFISDVNFAMQTSVAITSIMANKASETEYTFYIIAAGCMASELGELVNMAHVKIVETSMQDFENIRQMAHIPIACLLKFFVCDLIPEHEKLLYLDGDIIVRQDLSVLYSTELHECYAGAVFSRIDPGESEKKINAGIMLFNAKKMRDEQMGQKLMNFRRSLGDKASMDQQSFNAMLGKEILSLPAEYNCTPAAFDEDVKRYGMQRLNNLLGTQFTDITELVADACIIHYSTGLKPWKYKHTPYGDEWFSYYLKSPYGKSPLHRQGRLEQRFHIFVQEYQNGGIKTVSRRLWGFVKHKITGKRPDIKWG